MAGVSMLRVVSSPLSASEEPQQGPGLVQQAADLLRSYNVEPESALVGGAVGLFLSPSLLGLAKGALVGSLASFIFHKLQH